MSKKNKNNKRRGTGNNENRVNNSGGNRIKKICLCMIVKNESNIIERCLNSARPVIDYVSICDTGSTDDTPNIIKEWCERNKIPGTVHNETFKNFGHNRTLSVELAKKSYPEADYLLLLDADMILEISNKKSFNKNSLTQDQYHIMQYNKFIKYWNTRLIKTSLNWKCMGVTHEYWDCQVDHSLGKCDQLIIDDREDGGAKSDKFERDIRLLMDGINDPDTPSNLRTRYYFYAGQTEKDRCNYKQSISWYRKRIEDGGWAEEVYYSHYQIGYCYQQLGKIEKAIYAYSQAWEYRPSRAEPLYQISKIYRMKGNNNLSLMFSLQGKQIPFPTDDTLFVDYHVYDYLFDYEISICAFYVNGKKNVGRDAIKRLLPKIKDLPSDIALCVKSNAPFYN